MSAYYYSLIFMKSTLLAIDTSTDACSVALLHNGTIHSDHQLLPREHTQNILPMVESLLAKQGVAVSQLDGLVVGAGPGSFTGLRIAFGVVQGLAFAINKPVAAVSTLTALAIRTRMLSAHDSGELIATVDARMNELYWAKYRYSETAFELLSEPSVSKPADVNIENIQAMSGTGLVYRDQFSAAVDDVEFFPEERPRAEDMLTFIQEFPEQVLWQSADQVEPLYVRNDVAKKKADQKK